MKKHTLKGIAATREVYLAGFNTPIPNKIVELIEEYNQKGFPVKSIVNFWKLLMLNPDERIRTRLFDFLDVHDFVITDNGYIVAYKAVYRTEKNKFLSEFVTNNYIKVKKDWKCNPDKYVVYSDNGYYRITKKEIAEKNNLNVIGSLKSLYESIISGESDTSVFTDMYSQTMKIRLGQPVKIDRSECESNPYNECAKGLHVGATKYVENYANENSIILMCLVNPANVVAVPFHDCSKIRVCEYFPFAVTTFTDRKIDAIQEHYFEFDYINYEKEELERMLEAIRNEEMWTKECPDVPEPEYRSFEELQKIVESRIVDINTLFP